MYNPNQQAIQTAINTISAIEQSLYLLKQSLGVQTPGRPFQTPTYPGQFPTPPYPMQPPMQTPWAGMFGQPMRAQNPQGRFNGSGCATVISEWITNIEPTHDGFKIELDSFQGPRKLIGSSKTDLINTILPFTNHPRDEASYLLSIRPLLSDSLIEKKAWLISPDVVLVSIKGWSQVLVNADNYKANGLGYLDLTEMKVEPTPSEAPPERGWLSEIKLVGPNLYTVIQEPLNFEESNAPEGQIVRVTGDELIHRGEEDPSAVYQIRKLILLGIGQSVLKIWDLGEKVIITIPYAATAAFERSILDDIRGGYQIQRLDEESEELMATPRKYLRSSQFQRDPQKSNFFTSLIVSTIWEDEDDDAMLIATNEKGHSFVLDESFENYTPFVERVNGRSMQPIIRSLNKGVGKLVIVKCQCGSGLAFIQHLNDEGVIRTLLIEETKAVHYAGLVNDRSLVSMYPA